MRKEIYGAIMRNLKNDLTILIPTHFIVSAPGTDLIEATISSLNTEELEGCRCIINYDIPAEKSFSQLKYKENLEKIKTPFKLEVYSTVGGQRKSFLNMIDMVKTKYFFFLEHDWKFLKEVCFSSIIDLMKEQPGINQISFNKRDNENVGSDFVLKPAGYNIPLLKTSRWSNNPKISRTEKWIKDWRPLIVKNKNKLKKKRGQVEFIMLTYWKDIKEKGFDEAHKEWGCYLYGNMNDTQMIEHLDGNSFISNDLKLIKIRSKKIMVKRKSSIEGAYKFWRRVQLKRWEPETFNILDQYLDKDSIYIDIGAWVGATVLYASKIAKKCLCFEPDPIAYEDLIFNIKANKAENIIAVPKGILNEECTRTMGNRKMEGDSTATVVGATINSWPAKFTTLEKSLKENGIKKCSLIKIDTEGAEVLILPSMYNYLKEHKCPLYLSIHPGLVDNGELNEMISVLTDIYDKKIIIKKRSLLFTDISPQP